MWDRKWTGSEPEVNRKWTGSGPTQPPTQPTHPPTRKMKSRPIDLKISTLTKLCTGITKIKVSNSNEGVGRGYDVIEKFKMVQSS